MSEKKFDHLFNDYQTPEETRALIEQCARELYGMQADIDLAAEKSKAKANDAEDLEL